MKYHCHTCGRDNEIVNQCGCDPQNMPTRPSNPLYAEINRLRAANKELMAALKVCQVRVFMHEGSTCNAYRLAAAAIARAVGK